MTRREAREAAKEIDWHAMVRAQQYDSSGFPVGPKCQIAIRNPSRILGEGETWEEALADARKRQS